MKCLMAIFFILVTPVCWSTNNFPIITSDTWENNSSGLMQDIFDNEQKQNNIQYKDEQNKLPDSKREKRLSKNQYWLVNKKQDLWLGIFDGKQVVVPGGIYDGITEKTSQYQQVIRVKQNNRISQFLLTNLTQDGVEYPPLCISRLDSILKDSLDYVLFYSACTLEGLQLNSPQHEGYYDILFYSKSYDTLIRLNGFPYSASDGNVDHYSKNFIKIKDYYIDSNIEVAFKFIGKDQVVEIDPKTGSYKKPEKIQERDPSGQWILVDDPEQFKPDLLKRLPEVVVNN
ncbi:Uncharacterised protein [Yersinia frederiksenii]|nr:Uncharacterised protein [Yersinia frederiksenii]